MLRNIRVKLVIALAMTWLAVPQCGCADSASGTDKNEYSSFERMLSGFSKCEFNGVYVDIFTKMPVNEYFIRNELKPYKIVDGFAYFHLSEKFHGLPVYEISIPSSTFDVHAIYINAPIAEVKEVLEKVFYSGFSLGKEDDAGMRPVMMSVNGNANKTVVFCSPKMD